MPASFAAFSPCQITGFFQIHDEFKDPSRVGSTGAGVNVEQGVTTRVSLDRASRMKVEVFMNKTPLNTPTVSLAVIREYLKINGGPWHIQVYHECMVPMGTGYGTSGAGAASLSLAINEALGNIFDSQEALSVAHKAELLSRTGLGTVTAISTGGFNIRLSPGAPGIAQVRRIPLPSSLRVVSASFGPVSTNKVLSNRRLRNRVNLCGRALLSMLLRKPNETNFLALSNRFSHCLGLLTPRLNKLLKSMDEEGFRGSMMMIGEAAFCIVHEDTVTSVVRLMIGAGVAHFTSRIATRGARLI